MPSLRQLCLALICAFSPLHAMKQQPKTQELFSHFWNISEVLYKLSTKSYRTLDMKEIIDEGLKAMMSKVDAHSSFFTPKSYQETMDIASGHFAGIGISIISKAVEDDSLMIVDVITGGPSEASGIESGDKIVQVDGERLRGLTSDEVVAKLKGKPGSQVKLKIIRDKKPLSFELTRKRIQDKNVSGYLFPEQNTAYISIKTFDEQTPRMVRSFLERQKKLDGIILDLRKNTGGVFEASVDTASIFLPKKTVVVKTKNNKRETITTYVTHHTPLPLTKTPLFILVDNFTASSSEILAGALQHHAHAGGLQHVFVVGIPTFGKGSVQEVTPLSNGYALKLTSMLYYLPDDTCLQARGVQPDILCKPKKTSEVELKWVEEMYGKETSLKGHITREEVEGKQGKTPVKETPLLAKKEDQEISQEKLEQARKKTITHDHQVQVCLSLSRIYANAQKHAPHLVSTHSKALDHLQKTLLCDAPPSITPL